MKIYHAASSVDSTQDRFWMTSSAVPEPGAWAMMILGFGLAGTAIRTGRQRKMLFLAA
ncbi:MAG: PEPxxWA-CTERM sorting domain-containing protein [Pseudomonadota bacterium]|uniref:PEPxxWA-CTERM sorting domain-containing protein n=1 Tax=Phenylobacterium sp. TaxID=1871053 RepID=UPI0025FDE5F4|nr:PEPxxWA-CTERM sorting domain-containing protein [Phenylobacterium sp.]